MDAPGPHKTIDFTWLLQRICDSEQGGTCLPILFLTSIELNPDLLMLSLVSLAILHPSYNVYHTRRKSNRICTKRITSSWLGVSTCSERNNFPPGFSTQTIDDLAQTLICTVDTAKNYDRYYSVHRFRLHFSHILSRRDRNSFLVCTE